MKEKGLTNLELPESKKNIIDFPVVGIGASAGGLEALQEFFEALPDNPGAAFIIVQHLSPDFKSLMNELLARYTNMPIHKVEDGMMLKRNNVYLIPPKKNMTIFYGQLLLSNQENKKTLNLPIDIFFRSLARDQQKNAIAIILSGTGSDGTLGIREIKEYGGTTMVQDDKTAKFDGMPRSSISTGMVDFILDANDLAQALVEYIKHPLISQTQNIEDQINEESNHFKKIITLLRDTNNVDFSEYKNNTIIRRLEKRISINRFQKIEDYADYLSNNPQEVSVLFKELLIGVTRFFRDEEAYKKLYEKVLPELINNIKDNTLRLWVPACSTGEEAYSLAILISDYIKEKSVKLNVKIFATDIDTKSLEYAGIGHYPDSIVSDIEAARLSRYFTKKASGYQVNESIRGMVVFANQNLLNDPPFSKIHLISCRNFLIYLENDAQQKILSTFYLSLNKDGFLFLGSSESLGHISEGFSTIDSKNKIYKYKKGFAPDISRNYSVRAKNRETSNYNNFGNNKYRNIHSISDLFNEVMEEFMPPSVIVDSGYNIIHTVNDINKYLKFPKGKVDLNLLSLLPKDVGVMVSTLLRKSSKENKTLTFNNVESKEIDKSLSISSKRVIDKSNGELYYVIAIDEKDKKTEIKNKSGNVDVNEQYISQINELEKELQFKSESLQATVEELETSNEELQSSNEELIASNEELQSTNEELQSVNEELSTVNVEHQDKIEELSELNADIENLLRITNIGTLFLDSQLNIRKVNNAASSLTKIRKSDVGRPISDISLRHVYDNFIKDIKSVNDDLKPITNKIKDKDGNWHSVRILPYRNSNNAIMGLIVIFMNIMHQVEQDIIIDNLNQRLDITMSHGGVSWWEWNIKNNEVIAGNNKSLMLGYNPEKMKGDFDVWTKLLHKDDYDRVMKHMKEMLEGKLSKYNVKYRIKNNKGKYIWYHDIGSIYKKDKNGKPEIVTGIVININSEKQLEHIKEENKYNCIDICKKLPLPSIITNNDKLIYINSEASECFDISNKNIDEKMSDIFKIDNNIIDISKLNINSVNYSLTTIPLSNTCGLQNHYLVIFK